MVYQYRVYWYTEIQELLILSTLVDIS
jgi:hypothetical protein